MRFNKMLVFLSNEAGDSIELNYQIRNTLSAQIWAKCIHEAEPLGLRETNRFQNFPGQAWADIDWLIRYLEDIISSLQSLHPDLSFPQLDRDNLQQSVNELHFNFAHSHHVTKKINNLNRDKWSSFNVILHAIEAAIFNSRTLDRTGLNASKIVFTWNSSHKTDIPDECYNDFAIDHSFGTAYTNYAQVGRHFYEIFSSQDCQLADEHIQPYRFISADTNLYFGPTAGHGFSKATRGQIENWFLLRQERFNRLGFVWKDPRLAIGQIPVARLHEPLYTEREINSFISLLAKFTKVSKVSVV